MPDDGTTEENADTRTHALLRTCSHIASAWADPTVDIAAVLSIGVLVAGTSGVSEAVVQVAVGGITSIAVGKRYLNRGANA